MTELDDSIFDLWDAFVLQQMPCSCVEPSREEKERVHYACLGEAADQWIVTDDMVEHVLVVQFLNGDFYYYYFGQCFCDEQDDDKCHCIQEAFSVMTLMAQNLNNDPSVSLCRFMHDGEQAFVSQLYNPQDFLKHRAQHHLKKVETEQVFDFDEADLLTE